MKPYKNIEFLKSIKFFFQYIVDKDVSLYKKLFIVFAFLYLISPFDFIPDPILALGIIDDITVIALIFHYYQKELKKYKSQKPMKSKKEKHIIENIDFTVKDEKDDEKGKK